jgi:hypothetical protein
MTVLTPATVLAVARLCLPPLLAPIAAGIAQWENPRLDTTATNHNPNGTIDYGLGQINSSNLAWLHLTPQTVLDPCTNLRASMAVLFVRYNGNGSPEAKARYAAGILARISAVGATEVASLPATTRPTPQEPVVINDEPAGPETETIFRED